jgi:hypothetical protein
LEEVPRLRSQEIYGLSTSPWLSGKKLIGELQSRNRRRDIRVLAIHWPHGLTGSVYRTLLLRDFG